MDSMINRMIRAAKLDVGLFNEVEADTSLNQEALMVVVLVAIAGGIGSFIGGVMDRSFGAALLALIVGVVLGVVNYYIWSYVTHLVGTRLFDGTADVGELLRALGYATAPRVLNILGFIPCLGGLITLAGAIWALVAGFIAAREALDLDNTKTFFTVVIGWVVILVISTIIGLVLGVGAMGLGAAGSLLRGAR